MMDKNNALNGQEATLEGSHPEEQSQEQNIEKQASMESLLEEEGLSLDFPRQGEIRQGVIASIGESEILVSVGTKSEGVIPARELDQIDSEIRAAFLVGQEIPVYVINPEDPNGNVQLSYVRALEEQDWLQAESLLVSGDTYSGKVIGFNKGGVIVPLGQLRGFVPASQVSVLRRMDASGSTPEQRWGTMVGDPIIVQVIEVDRERRRLILSERAALQETRESLKERLLDELKEGDVRVGRVTSLADFGAFVNIEGADGLVHLSEISWERIENPKEVLRVGQEVKVKVIGVDRERKRIGLSIRQLQDDPWLKKLEGIKEGMLIQGAITHLTKFGAFARLSEDLEGLIHISELSEQRVAHPREVVHEGDVVTLRVIKIEPDRRRIGLSLRRVDSPAYADLDWKTTLADEVEESQEGEATPPTIEPEMEASEAATPGEGQEEPAVMPGEGQEEPAGTPGEDQEVSAGMPEEDQEEPAGTQPEDPPEEPGE
ncbi:MAG TPA: S1 RNA-binding domain-containing protein [Anaerolineales bacterium]|nr:S1 RNA-binding domain-containing protein [Anaerolineales bacterium]